MKDPTKTLDTVFQEYIRLRDTDENGVGFCISCGKPIQLGTGKGHAGHYYRRDNKATRWNPKNCNLQCYSCNTYQDANIQGYIVGLVKKYGESVVNELLIAKNSTRKYSNFEIIELIKYYRYEVKRLKKGKQRIK